MYARFGRRFRVTSPRISATMLNSNELYPPALRQLIDEFGGCSFENGLYRVLLGSKIDEWNKRIAGVFPDYRSRAICFGLDWLGRCFALDLSRREATDPWIMMFDQGTGDALELQRSIAEFHNEDLVKHREDILASRLFADWRRLGNPGPEFDQCISYKQPLFLGGKDEVGNLEICSSDMCWELSAQFLAQARKIPYGTAIGDVTLSD